MIRPLSILIFTCSGALGQLNNELVSVNTPLSKVQAGSEGVVKIEVEVKPGYHIQAHEIKNELLIPTVLSLASDPGLTIISVDFPRAKKFVLKGTEQALDVYEGKFEIILSLKPLETAQAKIYRLPAELRYQACDSMQCLFPRTVKFTVDVEIQ